MATYKSEFLSHHFEAVGRPIAHYAFGRIDRLARIANLLPFTPGLVNTANNLPGLAPLIKRTLHIHPNRKLPRFARAYTSRSRAPQLANLPRVVLWADTFNNYFHPGTMQSAEQVLRSAGFHVLVPHGHLCCGRPLYDFGMLATARQYLLRVLDALASELTQNLPIVVLEPSCASVFRDELTNLLPNDPRAARLRENTLLLSEFLVRFAPGYEPPSVTGNIVVHGHCHHRATFGMNDEMTLLRRTGAEVTLLDSGCCGMAGPFGFEREKYEISQTLGNRVLLPAIRQAPPGTPVVTDGFSCAEQITQNTEVRPLHLADLLAQRLP